MSRLAVLFACSIATAFYLRLTRSPEPTTAEPMPIKVFTAAELKEGSASGLLLLAVLGSVFDVTKGARHYAHGGSYHFFTGRDGSRAFATGDFTEAGLRDDVDGLEPAAVAEIERYRLFYIDEYTRVGVLQGRYYNGDGTPTAELDKVQELLKLATSAKTAEEDEKRRYPQCSTQWAQGQGGSIWCETKNDQRGQQLLVPRKYHSQVTKQKRCACVPIDEAAVAAAGRFELYADCEPTSSRCKTPP